MSDLISRQDAIDAIMDLPNCGNGYSDTYDKACIIGILEALPSADRPSGKWQRVNEQPYFRKHYHKVCCSVCHKQGSEKYNYCPNCGAKMYRTERMVKNEITTG